MAGWGGRGPTYEINPTLDRGRWEVSVPPRAGRPQFTGADPLPWGSWRCRVSAPRQSSGAASRASEETRLSFPRHQMDA